MIDEHLDSEAKRWYVTMTVHHFQLETLSQSSPLLTVLDDGYVQCHACGKECRIAEGAAGTCRVRFNRDGKLFAPWGFVAVAQVEPIEKKPFFHFMPGSSTYSFGLLGCDMHCAYCQNWIT